MELVQERIRRLDITGAFHLRMQCISCKILFLRFSREGDDLCITESHIGKSGIPGHFLLLCEDILHRRLCMAQVVEVDISFMVQNFKAPEFDHIARFSLCSHMDAPGHVLSEINDCLSFRRGEDPLRRHPVCHPHPSSCLGVKDCLVKRYFFHGVPVSFRCFCFRPSGDLQPGIVCLSVIDLREYYRGITPAPVSSCAYRFLAAILIPDHELHGECGLIPIIISRLCQPHNAFVPSGGKHCARCVFPLMEKPGHIIGLIQQVLPVGGPARRHLVLSHFLSVQEEIVKSQCRRISIGFSHHALYPECSAYISPFRAFFISIIVLCRYKGRLPLSLIQIRDKAGWSAPCTGLCPVTDLDPGIILFSSPQKISFRTYRSRLPALDSPAVIQHIFKSSVTCDLQTV